MGPGISFWIFVLSLFPNPIVEDGRVGFINNNGDTFIPPSHYSLLYLEAFSLEGFVENNQRISSNSEAFNDSDYGLAARINEAGDSLLILGERGRLCDTYPLNSDTVQMYYFLDGENEKVLSPLPMTDFLEIDKFDELIINVGLKNSKNEVVIPSLTQVVGLKYYFIPDIMIKFGKNLVKLNNYPYISEMSINTPSSGNIIDLQGNKIIEGFNSISFSDNQEYVVFYSQGKKGVINLKGEIVLPLQEGRISSVNQTMFTVKNAKSTSVLMNIQGDTLLSDVEGVYTSNFNSRYAFSVITSLEENIYGFINNNAEWILPPKKRDSINVSLEHNPRSDLFIVKYTKKRRTNVKQGIINDKGEWILKPKEKRMVSPISNNWFYVCETEGDSLSYFFNVSTGKKLNKANDQKSVKLINVSNEKFIIKYDTFLKPSEYVNIDIYKLNGEKIKHIDSQPSMFIPNYHSGDAFVIQQEEKHFLYNLRKSKIVSEGFDNLSMGSVSAFDAESHLFIATKNGKKGVINQEGKWVIKPIYHKILPFRGELALVQMDSTSFQYINRAGETVWKLPETDKTAWNKAAFLESFKNCEPSIYMQDQGHRTVYEYEIQQGAAEGGGCVVESRFLLNKNIEWIGKTMTCT